MNTAKLKLLAFTINEPKLTNVICRTKKSELTFHMFVSRMEIDYYYESNFYLCVFSTGTT